MAYFHEKEFFPFFLWIKLNDSFFVFSTTDFFSNTNLEYIWDTKSKTVPHCGKLEYNIRGVFPSRRKSTFAY